MAPTNSEIKDDLQTRRIARDEFERRRTQHSLKFCIGALLFLILYCTLYYVIGIQVLGWTCLPLLCVGIVTLLHAACVSLQLCQIRRGLAWRCDISGWALAGTLICDAVLVALTRMDVKIVIYQTFPDVMEDYLGAFPYEVNLLTTEQLALMKQDVNITTQTLQFFFLYFMLLVLSARHSCFVGVLGPTAYCFIGSVFGIGKLMPELSFGEMGLHMDLLLMLVSVGIMALAKVLIDRSKLKLFEVLESQREQIVSEKVLRCEAEFAKEVVLSSAAEGDSVSKEHCRWHRSFDEQSLAPSQAESAPAILAPLVPKHQDTCLQGSGDCLPSHALVWTEGTKLPQLLSSLVPGERILCYDNLSKNLTYASIKKLEKSRNTEWVKLDMEDGSMLEVTTDHPVAVQPEDGTLFKRSCMRAGEVKPGRDRLLMLKMVWVPISDVRHFSSGHGDDGLPSAEKTASDSITISVEQRERHEIFVSTGDKNGNPGPPIAVGSSDRSMEFFGSWKKKNTFVHFPTAASQGLKRSNSDPGLLRSGSGTLLSASSMVATSTAPPVKSLVMSDTSTVSESLCNSTISKVSDSDDCVVKLGRAPYDDPTSNIASLSAFARLKSNGIPSFGSEHAAHMCRSPCSFQFAGLVNAGRHCCTAGALCEYCHDTGHQTHMSSKLRKLSRLPKHLAKTKGRRLEQL